MTSWRILDPRKSANSEYRERVLEAPRKGTPSTDVPWQIATRNSAWACVRTCVRTPMQRDAVFSEETATRELDDDERDRERERDRSLVKDSSDAGD